MVGESSLKRLEGFLFFIAIAFKYLLYPIWTEEKLLIALQLRKEARDAK